MGLRFRKSFKIAPGVKLNLNKKSISLTAGTKGAHYTVNSKGTRTASVGIPGTGLSYVKTSGKSTATSKKKNSEKSTAKTTNISSGGAAHTASNGSEKKKGSCLLKIIGVFAVLGIIGILIPDKKIEAISITIPDYQQEYDVNTEIPVTVTIEPEDANTNDLKYETDSLMITFSESGINTGTEEGTYEVHVSSGDIVSNTLFINVIDITAREEAKAAEEAKRLAEEQAAKEAESQKLAEEQTSKDTEESEAAEESIAQMTEEESTTSAQTSQTAEAVADNTPAESSATPEQQPDAPVVSASAETAPSDASSAAVVPIAPVTDNSTNNSNAVTESAQQPVGDMVWLSATGKKYHRINNCGRMNPDKARQVTLDEALSLGMEKCEKCY